MRFTTGRLPWWVLAIGVLGFVFLVLPVVGLVSQLDLARVPGLLTSESALVALRLSVVTALATTALCLLLGVPLGLVLARGRFPGRRIARTAVLLPLVLPPVVGGIALLHTFGRVGLVGPMLEAGGLTIAFSTVAVVIAQTFVALPFMVLTVEGALRGRSDDPERMATGLGAGPTTVFLSVTLPMLRPALVSGTVLCFARALGEFGATIAFAGSLQGVTRTLPLEIYLQRETDPAGAVALSLLLVAVATVIVLVAYPTRARR
ncbi:ABC transporter permease [Brevibacterium litoralis]|uniref:ABC transporter permease n=1 Tax=Brevibacterium litoralis TaxID=3138935 RepID=UPI0032EC25C6